MTEMQSAIGRLQLEKLCQSVHTRRKLAGLLSEQFSRIPALRVTTPQEDVMHSYYKYYVFLQQEHLREDWDRQRIINAVNAEGVPCFVGSCSEIYLERAFPLELRPPKRLPVAKELGETALMFPVHPTLSELDMEDMAAATEKVLAMATK